MPRNGEINLRFGVYKSLCCGDEIIVREGATFPDCKKHVNLPTVWKPIDFGKSSENNSDRRSA